MLTRGGANADADASAPAHATRVTDCYTALQDLPVAGGATHIQLDDGSEYILVVHQGLWFGEELDVSLLNP